MNHIIDLKRLGFLARKDFSQIWRSSAITAGVVAGVILIPSFLRAVLGWAVFGSEGGAEGGADYYALFRFTLVVWGCIAASLSFRELHDKTQNEDFLLLPASSLEKTLVRLLWISVVLPLLILILLTVLSLLSEAIHFLLLDTPLKIFNPFAGRNWEMMGTTIVLQSLFFVGAAWFKKAHLIKTILTASVLFFILGVISVLVFRIVFASYFHGFFTPIDLFIDGGLDIDVADMIHNRFPALMKILEVVGRIVGHGLLAPFCWFVAWLRVRETQSSDGV